MKRRVIAVVESAVHSKSKWTYNKIYLNTDWKAVFINKQTLLFNLINCITCKIGRPGVLTIPTTACRWALCTALKAFTVLFPALRFHTIAASAVESCAVLFCHYDFWLESVWVSRQRFLDGLFPQTFVLGSVQTVNAVASLAVGACRKAVAIQLQTPGFLAVAAYFRHFRLSSSLLGLRSFNIRAFGRSCGKVRGFYICLELRCGKIWKYWRQMPNGLNLAALGDREDIRWALSVDGGEIFEEA